MQFIPNGNFIMFCLIICLMIGGLIYFNQKWNKENKERASYPNRYQKELMLELLFSIREHQEKSLELYHKLNAPEVTFNEAGIKQDLKDINYMIEYLIKLPNNKAPKLPEWTTRYLAILKKDRVAETLSEYQREQMRLNEKQLRT